jgi:hypothetical protein
MAAFNVPRIHSDTVWLLALAAAATAFKRSAVKRTGTILPLAWPFGSFGRPIFLGLFGLILFGTGFELLNDCSLHGGLRRDDWRDMKHRHMAFWVGRIVSLVHPRINPIRFWVTLQAKDFDNAVPYHLAFKYLRHWHTLQVLSPCTV